MNIFKHNAAKLNNIVFENRNKNYGAYAIRSSYHDTILKSLGFTVSFFGTLILLATKLNNTTPVEIKLDTGSNIIPDRIIEVVIPQKVVENSHSCPPIEGKIKTVSIPTTIIDEKDKAKNNPIETIENTSTLINTNSAVTINGSTLNGVGATDNNGIENGITNVEPTTMPDVMPKFADLPNFLAKNLHYPQIAKEAGISGKVMIHFIIDENGDVLNATIIKKLGAGCDDEVMRVIKLMPKWTPGILKGKPVKVSFYQGIDFKLQ